MNIRLIVAALLLSIGVHAYAADAPGAGVRLADLTWTELKARVDGGATTILVPIGGTEQNGPHMTLGKHNARAAALAERIAHALGDALVAPVIAYVPEGTIEPPSAHLRFPGTIGISDAAFDGVLDGAARSFRHAGFRTIVFLGDHGGYRRALDAVAARLDRRWAATGVRVLAPHAYYDAADQGFAAALAQRGYRADEIGTHAGLADTSLALAIDPALVRADKLSAPPAAAQGVHGDPRRSSAELGRLGADAIVADTVAAIRAAAARR